MKTPGGGAEKGGRFERDACRRLSLWVTAGARDDIFWRSASSGGRATHQLKRGQVNVMQSGDICAVDPLGYPFIAANFVELKHRKDLGIARSLVCRTGLLASFWRKACREAAKYGKRPLLVARQNFYPTLALVERGSGIFKGEPLMTLRWGVDVYLFDEATHARPRMVRRTG